MHIEPYHICLVETLVVWWGGHSDTDERNERTPISEEAVLRIYIPQTSFRQVCFASVVDRASVSRALQPRLHRLTAAIKSCEVSVDTRNWTAAGPD